MKYAMSIFVLLVVSISGLLVFQYQGYSDKLETGNGEFSYSQEIDITYRNGKLDIRQHFHQLTGQSMKIVWPKMAINTECFIETENSCNRLSEDKTKFKSGESPNQSLSYVIPLEEGLTSNQLIKDLFVKLVNGKVNYTTVHITTDANIQGQWVTGLPFIGQQSLSLVNYAMFSGSGDVSDLYWQSNNMNVQQVTDGLTVYSAAPLNANLTKELQELQLLSEGSIAVVQGENRTNEQGNRIVFVDKIVPSALYETVLLSQIRTQYQFGNSPKWLSEVVTSLVTGTPIGGEKSVEIANTLFKQLSKKQLKSLNESLEQLKGEKLDSEKLDKLISNILGNHTKYLTMNVASEDVYPFLFNDRRALYINEQLYNDIFVVVKDGMVMYSAESLLQHLDYKIKEGKNGFYVENATQSFRFPQNYGFYVFNEQRYNTISEPITVIAGNHFIEEAWLQRLFNVEVNKSDKEIIIKATAAGQQ